LSNATSLSATTLRENAKLRAIHRDRDALASVTTNPAPMHAIASADQRWFHFRERVTITGAQEMC